MDPLDDLLAETGFDDVDALLEGASAAEANHAIVTRKGSANNSQPIVPYESSSGDLVIPEDLYPKLENTIASCQLRVEVDLKKVAFRIRNAEYNPRKVNAVVVRFRTPRATAMIYQPGKVMITGAKSEEEAALAARKAAKMVFKCGYEAAVFSEFKVENLVASTDVRFPVRLETVAHEHRATSSYEPELFPGLVYRLFSPKVSILVFVSGKVVITGARSRLEIREAFEKIYPVLYDNRK